MKVTLLNWTCKLFIRRKLPKQAYSSRQTISILFQTTKERPNNLWLIPFLFKSKKRYPYLFTPKAKMWMFWIMGGLIFRFSYFFFHSLKYKSKRKKKFFLKKIYSRMPLRIKHNKKISEWKIISLRVTYISLIFPSKGKLKWKIYRKKCKRVKMLLFLYFLKENSIENERFLRKKCIGNFVRIFTEVCCRGWLLVSSIYRLKVGELWTRLNSFWSLMVSITFKLRNLPFSNFSKTPPPILPPKNWPSTYPVIPKTPHYWGY